MTVWSPTQYDSKPNSSARLATLAGSAVLFGVTCISPISTFMSSSPLTLRRRPASSDSQSLVLCARESYTADCQHSIGTRSNCRHDYRFGAAISTPLDAAQILTAYPSF